MVDGHRVEFGFAVNLAVGKFFSSNFQYKTANIKNLKTNKFKTYILEANGNIKTAKNHLIINGDIT